MATSKELITEEADKLIESTQKSVNSFRTMAIGEAWKLLQIATATIIQIIEKIGDDISSPDKKELAMNLLNKFYDNILLELDVPYIPRMLEVYVHKYVKMLLMILVSSTIDSMVTIFRNTGVFLKKSTEA